MQMPLVITAANCLMTEDDVTEWLQQDSDLPGVQELTDTDIIECPKSAERRQGLG